MYLFTRSLRIRPGNQLGGIEWAVAAAELVSKTTGREVNAWTSVLSPQAETITWTLWSETMADVIEAGDKLATSSSWHDLLQRGIDRFDGPIVDGLLDVVHGMPEPAGGAPAYVNVVAGAAAPGRLSDALTGGVELAERAAKVTGVPVFFAVNTTGPFGGVAWFAAAPDIATVDAANAALRSDPEWLALVDRHGTAYLPNGDQSLHRLIA